MKSTVSPRMVAILLLGAIVPLSAQNPTSVLPAFSTAGAPPFRGSYVLPAVAKAAGSLPERPPAYASQRAFPPESLPVAAIPEADGSENVCRGLAILAAAYRESGKAEQRADCTAIGLSVEQQVMRENSRLLEIVEAETGANPGCACEIVKAAIVAAAAEVPTVVAIVEIAISASPENMRIVSQCAIAACPEAIAEVQALLARLDPGAGGGSSSANDSKDSKDAKDAKVGAAAAAPPLPNPLDRLPLFPPGGPPPIYPPVVTDVNFTAGR